VGISLCFCIFIYVVHGLVFFFNSGKYMQKEIQFISEFWELPFADSIHRNDALM